MHPDERGIYVALLTAGAAIVLLGLYYTVMLVFYQKKRVKAYLSATKAEFTLLEAERVRISSDLHDGAGASITGIKLKLLSVQALNAEQKEIFTDINVLMEDLAVFIRTIAYEVQPLMVQHNSLESAIEELLIPFYQSGLYQISFLWQAEVRLVQPDTAFHIYRIAQEILNNIAKHAQASRIEISVSESRGDFCLSISDNGKGFSNPYPAKPGMGLRTIRMRADLLQALLSIDTKLKTGSVYVLQIPKKMI